MVHAVVSTPSPAQPRADADVTFSHPMCASMGARSAAIACAACGTGGACLGIAICGKDDSPIGATRDEDTEASAHDRGVESDVRSDWRCAEHACNRREAKVTHRAAIWPGRATGSSACIAKDLERHVAAQQALALDVVLCDDTPQRRSQGWRSLWRKWWGLRRARVEVRHTKLTTRSEGLYVRRAAWCARQ